MSFMSTQKKPPSRRRRMRRLLGTAAIGMVFLIGAQVMSTTNLLEKGMRFLEQQSEAGLLLKLLKQRNARAAIDSNGNNATTTRHTANRPQVVTWLEQPPQSSASAALLDLWKEWWTMAGWDPKVMIGFDYCKEHEECDPDELRGSAAQQWLSLSAMALGQHENNGESIYWMSQPDVFPIRPYDPNDDVSNGYLTLWENVVPSLTSGTAREFERGAKLLKEEHALARMSESSGSTRNNPDILALIKITRDPATREQFENARQVWSGDLALSSTQDGIDCDVKESKRAVHFASQSLEEMEEWLLRYYKKCLARHGKTSSPAKGKVVQIHHHHKNPNLKAVNAPYFPMENDEARISKNTADWERSMARKIQQVRKEYSKPTLDQSAMKEAENLRKILKK